MSTDITAFLAIDDNSPPDLPPFANDPSCWDLSEDLGLRGCKDYAFYAAIAGVRNDSGKEPLIPPRGLPKYPTLAPFGELELDFGVGWLTLAEVEAALRHHGLDRNSLASSVQLVLNVMATVESMYGRDRVQLVFGFS